jgi:hypothetical protein
VNRILAIVAATALSSCGGKPDRGSSGVATAAVLPPARQPTEALRQVTPLSQDSVEASALASAEGSAQRTGDTLFIILTTGRRIPFMNTEGEAPGGYRYVGRLADGRYELLEEYGHETYPRAIILNRRTGQMVSTSRSLLFSADGSHFAVADADWQNCTELDQPGMEVWRMTDSVPVREWKLTPWACKTRSGWGPTDPSWRGSDSLDFVRNEISHDKSSVRAVRDNGRWHLDPP